MHRLPASFAVLSILLLSTIFVSAQNDRLQIVASHTILADVVANVAGEAADVISLIPANADPHAFVPTPSDLTRLANADLIFVNGALFEEGLLESIENAAEDLLLIEVSQCVPILPFGVDDHETIAHEQEAISLPEDEIVERCDGYYAEMEILHEESSTAEAAPEVEPDHAHTLEPLGPLYSLDCRAGHDHAIEPADAHTVGSCDPHVWWDVQNVIYWTMTIRDTLIELDPSNADVFQANADGYIHALDTLVHDELHPLIETLPEDRRIFVTDHDSMGYFANAYGFTIVGVVASGGSTLAESSATELAEVIDIIRKEEVSAIFVGTTVSSTLSEQIAEEAGAQVIVIYTDSLSELGGDAPTYLNFMRYNVHTIVEALNS